MRLPPENIDFSTFLDVLAQIRYSPLDHHWGTKKICTPETQESQRFLGFFTSIFTEEIKRYLRGFLQELNDLNDQIIMNGNTAELLEKVHKKYTELWLFQLYFHVYSLPRVIGGLLRYPNDE